MAVEQFNLATNQRAERKKFLTVVEWTEMNGTTPVTQRELLGRRTEDSSLEMNNDIQQSTDILGITYTDVNKTQPQQDFDPYLVLGGSKLGAFLYDKVRRNALSEYSSFKVYLIAGFIGDSTNGFATTMHEDCTITVNSIGGDANVNMPISLYLSNKITNGTVDKLGDDFTFTPDVSV